MNTLFTKKLKPLKVSPLKLSAEEIKAVEKGAKKYKISAHAYKRGSIIKQLTEDGLYVPPTISPKLGNNNHNRSERNATE